MKKETIETLARELIAGHIPLDEFVRTLETLDGTGTGDPASQNTTPQSIELDEVTLDADRASRCGYPEVIYGEGKSAATIGQTVERLRSLGQPVLCTRLDSAKAATLCRQFPDAIYHERARTFRLPVHLPKNSSDPSPPAGQVALITAGTSDLPVAEEARETLLWMGITPTWIQDVGVAGPHRLREQLDKFTQAAVIIVVAGMEGALPSVVGGYARCPVIAVPTSVGYGASLGGIAPLLGMLNSCAANVLVVNIDAGFKAGYVAGMIARQSTPATTAFRTPHSPMSRLESPGD